MKFATRPGRSPDGQLLLVSRDLRRAVAAPLGFATLRDVLESWSTAVPAMDALYTALNACQVRAAFDLDGIEICAPLPRAWQWLDASAFPSHGELMQQAFNLPPIESTAPLMYQGMSHRFYGPCEAVPMMSEDDGIDFEAEFAVITDHVAMGTPPAEALDRIRLCVLVNDWSLRAIAPIEMKTGFGWIQAKPACSLGPIAVTPDELGDNWRDGRVDATMSVRLNDAPFGAVPAGHMAWGFHELITHAARTRDLCPGTLIGSGTVSTPEMKASGSCCIAERRALEMLGEGKPRTPFMRFGDRVRIEAFSRDGASPFGAIDQTIVSAGQS